MLILAGPSGCASKDPDYFPLAAGRSWRYRVVMQVLDAEYVQKYMISNLGPSTYDGHRIFVQRVQAADFRYLTKDAAGIRRIASRTRASGELQHDSDAPYILKLPPQADETWQLSSRLRLIESRTFAREDKLYKRDLPVTLTYVVEKTDVTVDVPAGRYRSCIKVRATGATRVPVDRGTASAAVKVEVIDWYAPGVGLVKSERHERSDSVFLQDGAFRLELEHFGT